MGFDKKAFGKRIRMARQAKGLTKNMVETATGINAKTLGGYEAGKTLPNIESLYKLAKVYSVNPDDLLKGGKADGV